MRKPNIIRHSLKERRKEEKKNISKLRHRYWSVAFLGISVILLAVSGVCFKCCPWLSGVWVSASCGGFTGFAFYFLSNKRNNQERKITKEYNSIKHTYDILNEIMSANTYVQYIEIWQVKESVSDIKEMVLEYLDKLEKMRAQIDSSVYDCVPSKGYDPMDRDNMNGYRDKLKSADSLDSVKKSVKEICTELLAASETLYPLLQEREDQISSMNTSSL